MFEKKKFFLKVVKNRDCILKGELALNPFPNKPILKSTENAVGKTELTHNEQFFLFQQFFLLFQATFHLFIKLKIVVCKLFQFGTV